MADVKTYEDGLIEGRLGAVETMLGEHKGRLDNHAQRLQIGERVIYALGGVLVLIQVFPAFQKLID